MIKVGVIGYGYSARTFHVPLLRACEQLQWIAISSSRPEAVREQHPGMVICANAEELIAMQAVELVVITAPNATHYPLAKLCLQQGKHVVVEKPMANTAAEAQELAALAQAQNLILSVFHNRRWDGDFLSVKKVLQQQSLGELRVFESHFDRFRPLVKKRWKAEPGPGSGIWYDLGSHLVDQALTLFGPPQALTARCLALRDNAKVADYFHVQLHYARLEVILHCSTFCTGPNRRFCLEGTRGSYIKFGLDPQEDQLKNGMLPLQEGFGVEAVEQYGTLYTESGNARIETEIGAYRQYYAGLADAIRHGGRNPVNAQDIVQVMTILELAERGSREGRTLRLDGISGLAE